MINEEPQEIYANIQKNTDCSRHVICHCICHNPYDFRQYVADHIVACCYRCKECGKNVIFNRIKDE